MVYSLKLQPTGYSILQRDGKDMLCPFQPVQYLPMPTGEYDLKTGLEKMKTAKISEQCGDKCPLMEVKSRGFEVVLHCGGAPRTFSPVISTESTIKPMAQA